MHTYLAVGDVKDVTVEGLDGARYFDKVRGRFATQVGDVSFVGPTDRVYTTTQQVQVVDPKLDRRTSSTRTAQARRSCGIPGRRRRRA